MIITGDPHAPLALRVAELEQLARQETDSGERERLERELARKRELLGRLRGTRSTGVRFG